MLLVSPRIYRDLLIREEKPDSSLDLNSDRDLVLSIDGSYRAPSGVAAFAVIKSSKTTPPRLVSKGIHSFEENKAQSRSEVAEFAGYRAALSYCSMLSGLTSRKILIETDCIDVERIYEIAMKKVTGKDISASDKRFLKGIPSKQKAPLSTLPDRAYRVEALNEQIEILRKFHSKKLLGSFKVVHKNRRSTTGMTFADNFAAGLTLSEATKQKVSRSKIQEANLYRYVSHSKEFYENLLNFFEDSKELLSSPREKGWGNVLEERKKETRRSLVTFTEQERALMKGLFKKEHKGAHKNFAISYLLDLPLYGKLDLVDLFFDEDSYNNTNSPEYRALSEAYSKIRAYLDFYSHVKAPVLNSDTKKASEEISDTKKVEIKGVTVSPGYRYQGAS